jgi:hypothetical protein
VKGLKEKEKRQINFIFFGLRNKKYGATLPSNEMLKPAKEISCEKKED